MDVTTILGIAVIACFGLLWLGAFVKWLYRFFDERTYIIIQLNRCESEKSREHWKKKLHDFYLSKIPLVGRWLKDRRR